MREIGIYCERALKKGIIGAKVIDPQSVITAPVGLMSSERRGAMDFQFKWCEAVKKNRISSE